MAVALTFKKAVEQTPHLEDTWNAGLGALRVRDKSNIKMEDSRRLRGSTDIDSALQQREPNANRWDYAIGYQHTNRKREFVYWVETHTGSDSEVKVVLRKLAWLKEWLKREGQKLAKFEREIIWVPSGPTSFTKGATQVKILAEQGLLYSGSLLRIPDRHPVSSAAEQPS